MSDQPYSTLLMQVGLEDRNTEQEKFDFLIEMLVVTIGHLAALKGKRATFEILTRAADQLPAGRGVSE